MRRSHPLGRPGLVVAVGVIAVSAGVGGWFLYRYYMPGGPAPGTTTATPAGKPAPKLIEDLPRAPTGRDVARGRTEPSKKEPNRTPEATLVADEQVIEPPGTASRPTSRPAATAPSTRPVGDADAAPARAGDERRGVPPAVDAARKRFEQGKVIEARHELNALLGSRHSSTEEAEIRDLLAKTADATIFNKTRVEGDPLVEIYTIQPGDNLIKIGRKFEVPFEVIMKINGISRPEAIRADQKLKVPRGPFHARIHKSQFRMDLYLQDLYLRSYPVGLGADQGTPTGVWKVKERLPNPTYYPPSSSPIKRVVPPDDPANPLGEHWIGLEGSEGDAVGHEGYGIHGTIEPESIGKAASLGCVRMHNEDVAFVYALLLPGHSTVTILP